MSCDCNTPTSSGGNTASTDRAYLTNPVTAPAESCYTPPENPCAVPVSRRRYLVDFIPGWLQKLTGAAKGKMLIGVGDTLHFFKGDNPGPLYFDGQDVSVGEQSTLTTKANEGSVIERGFLTLAKKVRRGKVLPNGSVADVDYFEHGVQAVREVSSGELVGLTTDPASGAVRQDVIQPTERNLITKGLPDGFRRLGYVNTLIDGACGKVPAKEFLGYQGAVFAESELNINKAGGSPAVLNPVTISGLTYYILGTPKDGILSGGFSASEIDNEEGLEEAYKLYSQVSVSWTDEDGDRRISYKDASGNWYHPVDKGFDVAEVVYAIEETGDPVAAVDHSEEIELTSFGVPADARFVYVVAEAKATRVSYRPPGAKPLDVFAILEVFNPDDVPSGVRIAHYLYDDAGAGETPGTVRELKLAVKIKIPESGLLNLTFEGGNGAVGQSTSKGTYSANVWITGWSR